MSAKFPNGVAGHVVSMHRAYASVPTSLAVCECGWRSELPTRHFRKQDRAIDKHWAEVSDRYVLVTTRGGERYYISGERVDEGKWTNRLSRARTFSAEEAKTAKGRSHAEILPLGNAKAEVAS
jgi:hypothetical protein